MSLGESGLTITPLRATMPPAVKVVRQALYNCLPRVRITDVLLNIGLVDRLLQLLYPPAQRAGCDDSAALLICVLVDGINLGLTRMSETCRAASDHVFGLMSFFGYRFARRRRNSRTDGLLGRAAARRDFDPLGDRHRLNDAPQAVRLPKAERSRGVGPRDRLLPARRTA